MQGSSPYFEAIFINFMNCGNDVKYGHKNRAKFPLSKRNFNSKLYLGISMVLLSVIGNYTYSDYLSIKCNNGISTAQEFKPLAHLLASLSIDFPSPEASFYYTLRLNDSLQTMSFVSCGEANGLQAMTISELYDIFDKFVWICLGVSTILACIALDWTSRKTLSCACILAKSWHFIKALLEQGGPFPDNTCRNSNPIIATAMFAAIVLSNAYKNTNVYNLILPREPTPFTDITELVKANFTIYSKPVFVFAGYIFLNEEIRIPSIFNETGRVSLTTNFASNNHGVEYSIYPSRKFQEYKLKVLSEIYTKTERSPYKTKTKNGIEIEKIGQVLPATQILKKMALYSNSNNTEYRRYTTYKFYSKFRAQADTLLLEHLNSCKKTAAILPDYWSKHIAKDLKRAKLKNVFVGKDRYFEVNYGFYIQGRVHRNVIRRISAFQFSGIWNWWPKFAKDQLQNYASYGNRDLVKPSMEGNIQVIFYILSCGMFAGFLCFIAELHKIVIKLVKTIYSFIGQQYIMFSRFVYRVKQFSLKQ